MPNVLADHYISQSGDVTVPPGTYEWHGTPFDIKKGDSFIGGGNPGDVVFKITRGTMGGHLRGTLKNIVVRGRNPSGESEINTYPGCTLDGFVWPEGAPTSSKDSRALFDRESGSEPATFRNSAWAHCRNNGAYTMKGPKNISNVVALNNNISQVRVGNGDGAPHNGTIRVNNCVIGVVSPVPANFRGDHNGRGLYIREPGNFIVENCTFVNKDVTGAGNMIEMHDPAYGNVTIRNCHFYNDSKSDIINDHTNGSFNITVQNCVFDGSGSSNISASYSGSGVRSGNVTVPLPSRVTGRSEADLIAGVTPGTAPFASAGTKKPSQGQPQHTGTGIPKTAIEAGALLGLGALGWLAYSRKKGK